MSKRRNKQKQQAKPAHNQQNPSRCQHQDGPCLYPARDHISPEEKQHYADQKQSAEGEIFWLKWQNIVNGLGVAAAIVGLYFISETLKTTQEGTTAAKVSAEVSKESLIRSNRPWIKVTHSVISPLNFEYDA